MKKSLLIFSALLAMGLVFHFSHKTWAEDDEGGGTIVFTKPLKAVVFDHKKHLDAGLDCDSCHDDLFQEAAGTAEENPDFNMKSLYDGKYCGDQTAFASNTQCAVCHVGVIGYNKMHQVDKSEQKAEEGHH